MLALACCTAAGAIAWLALRLARRFARYEIAGESMLPALRPRDWVIVDRRAYAFREPREGEIALASDPRDPRRTLVKRIRVREPGGDLSDMGAVVEIQEAAHGAFADAQTPGQGGVGEPLVAHGLIEGELGGLQRSERNGGALPTRRRGRRRDVLSGRDVAAESGDQAVGHSLQGRRLADPLTRPHSIFVTAIDTEPLAPRVEVVLDGAHGPFENGLKALAQMTAGVVYVCTAPDARVPVPAGDRFRREEFAGVHPAGTPGVHIHRLDPVNRNRQVWHVGYQDVVAIGRLFETGELAVERVVALAGPALSRPRLVRTRLGAAVADVLAGESIDDAVRVVSGSLLAGRPASDAVTGFLGRYHRQICLIREGREREWLGWLRPGLRKFSASRAFLSTLWRGQRFPFTTSTHGSRRAIVPIGLYERVMPLDLLPTPLLRALVMHDVERAEELGCLELEEDDLALCSFVCPSKLDYGAALRRVLTTLEAEG